MWLAIAHKFELLMCKANIDLNKVKRYLFKYPWLKNYHEIAPLHRLFDNKDSNIHVIEYLLIEGFDPNYLDSSCTPLHVAIKNGKQNIVKIKCLLDYGADVNAKDQFGNTPIFYATHKWQINVLLQHGAKHDVVNKSGENAALFLCKTAGANLGMHFVIETKCCDKKILDSIMFLVDDPNHHAILTRFGANPNVKCINGYYPVIQAILKNNLVALTTLLECGADANAVCSANYYEKEGVNALMLARNNGEMIKIL